MVYHCVAILVALVMLTSCTITLPPVGTPSATPGSTVPGNGNDALVGTSWALTGLGIDAAIPVVAGSTVTLEFSANGQAGGNAGCNSYGGDYTVAGEMISFGELVSTLMACADTAVMDQEQEYLATLDSADHFAIDGNQLTIWDEEDGGTLTFTAATAATPGPTDAAATVTPAVPLTPLPTVTPAPTTA